jgi:hypothetical protein
MDQPFDSEFRENLIEEYPFLSESQASQRVNDDIWESGEGLVEESETEEFLEAEESKERLDIELGDKLEEVPELLFLETLIIEALDAENAEKFFKKLYRSLSHFLQQATPAQKSTVNQIKPLLPFLKRYAGQGFDESEALKDLAPRLAQEDTEQALTIFGAIAARTLLKPLLGTVSPPLDHSTKEQLIQSTTQAAKILRNLSSTALTAFPRIIQTVSQTALRRHLSLSSLPQALHNIVVQVAKQPSLVQQLTRIKRPTPETSPVNYGRNLPQRLIFQGPIEIIILSH